MINQLAFWFGKHQDEEAYLGFAFDIANEFDLHERTKKTTERQLVNEEDLVAAAGFFGIPRVAKNDHGLDEHCINVLTRLVRLNLAQYSRENCSLILEYSSQNDYPVTGAELWENGIATLPAGMVFIEGRDQEDVDKLTERFREYISQCLYGREQ